MGEIPSQPPRLEPGPFDVGWLVRLRWLVAACGVLATLAAYALGLFGGFGIWVPAGFVLWVGLTQFVLFRSSGRAPRRTAQLGALFVADVCALTVALYFTGGPANPFSALYLVYVSLSAVALGARWAWSIVALCCVSYGLLFVHPSWNAGNVKAEHAHHGHGAHAAPGSNFDTHLAGMWWAFAISAALSAAFLTRAAQEIRVRDRALSAAREHRERYQRVASMMSLAASAAHEMGSPLSTIAVVAKELERELPEASKAEAVLVRREVDRCRRILDRLSARSGQLVGERPEPLTLKALAERVRAELPSPLTARLDVELGPEATLHLPPQASAVAVANLVVNGLEASPAGERVRLVMRVERGVLEVDVHDVGIGVDAETVPALFDPFVSSKAERGGMGLGLYIVKALLEPLRGSLELRPNAPRGTVAELRVAARLDVEAPA